MKLDQHIPRTLGDDTVIPDGSGKYALIHIRKLRNWLSIDVPMANKQIIDAIQTLEEAGILYWGLTPETEFFAIKLKDRHAQPALYAYADSAILEDEEYGREICDMADRSGPAHPYCKLPD